MASIIIGCLLLGAWLFFTGETITILDVFRGPFRPDGPGLAIVLLVGGILLLIGLVSLL